MKKLSFFLALCLLLGCCLGGCSGNRTQTKSYYLMDTVITITLYTSDKGRAEEIFSRCQEILEELDALWARQKPQSEIAKFNQMEEGTLTLDSRTADVIEQALAVSAKTEGAFDPTLAPLSDLWTSCGERGTLPTEEELRAALSGCGYEKLTLQGNELTKTAGLAIDLGGIGKGAAVDQLLAYLNTCDLEGGLISFGSNVAVFGKKPNGKPFRIALRDPKDAQGSGGVLLLPEGSVLSVSGDYERYVTIDGKNYHHILDSKTGYPCASGLSGVAVICEDGALADALSTALLCMGYDKAMELYQFGTYAFEAVFVTSDGEVISTKGLDGIFVEE